jgi:hypothetical protein
MALVSVVSPSDAAGVTEEAEVVVAESDPVCVAPDPEEAGAPSVLEDPEPEVAVGPDGVLSELDVAVVTGEDVPSTVSGSAELATDEVPTTVIDEDTELVLA